MTHIFLKSLSRRVARSHTHTHHSTAAQLVGPGTIILRSVSESYLQMNQFYFVN